MLIIGCVVLIAGCGSLGLWLAHRIRLRPVELRECLMALALLDTEIVWGIDPFARSLLYREGAHGSTLARFFC